MKQNIKHLIVLKYKRYSKERKLMTVVLEEERLLVSLQTLFCIKVRKKVLARFLINTDICITNWYNNTK